MCDLHLGHFSHLTDKRVRCTLFMALSSNGRCAHRWRAVLKRRCETFLHRCFHFHNGFASPRASIWHNDAFSLMQQVAARPHGQNLSD